MFCKTRQIWIFLPILDEMTIETKIKKNTFDTRTIMPFADHVIYRVIVKNKINIFLNM